MYLDMNGIFHNCSHGVNAGKNSTHAEIFLSIMKYIAYLVRLVKPKKLLYLAVDGVAPRAKQNQQRKRRFVAARGQEAEKKGGQNVSSSFDSSAITPGTHFMEELNKHLTLFIRKQMAEDGLWKNLTVIYSSHLVPGEGEHKIMSYIRHIKMQPPEAYDSNTRHCIYGLDADLIILSLVSHELHFALLREEIIFALQEQERQNKMNQKRLNRKHERGHPIKKTTEHLNSDVNSNEKEREEKRQSDENANVNYVSNWTGNKQFNLERIIDDFVFLCTLVGNDFIPPLPTISIATGGLEHLFLRYKAILPQLPDYLTYHGKINMESVYEYFQKMSQSENSQLQEQLNFLKDYWKKGFHRTGDPNVREPTIEEIDKELELLKEDSLQPTPNLIASETSAPLFKDHYYRQRWPDGSMDTPEARAQLCRDYLQGLQWVLQYYYHGIPSWSWFYPHHYAPLLSDVLCVGKEFTCEFTLDAPFSPFEQLLAVLPIASARLLPQPFRKLMTLPMSPIAGMYPVSFTIDMDYATAPWEGIALLPFIDHLKLKKAVAMIDYAKELTEEEKQRNSFDDALMFKFDTEKALLKNRIEAPALFGSVIDVTSVDKFENPPIVANNGKFLPEPYAGSVTPIEGFPQLRILDFSTSTSKVCIGCNIFGLTSKYETMILSIENQLRHLDAERDYEYLDRAGWNFASNNNTCFVQWPYLREGKVVTVETCRRQFSDRDEQGNSKVTDKSQQACAAFETEAAQLRQSLLRIFGIDVGSIHIIIKVRVVTGMKRMSIAASASSSQHSPASALNQQAVKTWSTNLVCVPLQLVVSTKDKNLIKDGRFTNKIINVEAELKLGAPVMYIGHMTNYFGKVGRIIRAPQNGMVDIRLIGKFERTSFGHNVIKKYQQQARYFSIDAAAKLVKISTSVFSRICGVVTAKHYRDEIDLGLKLRLATQKFIIPGYVRAIGGRSKVSKKGYPSHPQAAKAWKEAQIQFEFSQKAVDLLIEYKTKFPLVFQLLHTFSGYKLDSSNFAPAFDSQSSQLLQNGLKDKTPSLFSSFFFYRFLSFNGFIAIYVIDTGFLQSSMSLTSMSMSEELKDDREELAKKKQEGFVYLTNVVEWLRTQEFSQLPLLECSAQALPKDIILEIEDDANKYYAEQITANSPGIQMQQVPVHHVYASDTEVAWSPTNHNNFNLGDRVAWLRSDQGVPFGTLGTVVGVHNDFLEVLTDRLFASGTTLHNRCSDGRGLLVTQDSAINLTSPYIFKKLSKFHSSQQQSTTPSGSPPPNANNGTN
ncbi:hypothetical protein RFI_22856 [Reticulomyxa filosa]|uniref:Uncharacterized protein n=1 Tax=Reticulomyxa filosa TaxID=46433 RepID=X6MLI2_RETFI|nr:hypothetical protein RFI_22856 [Reticulomyxa filosa]|eukprot:ETO14496.1 hypothetical protein RFI_22856 [Reticulomyxa filosa]